MTGAIIAIALVAACLLLIVRLARGPTSFDRLCALQGIVTCTAVLPATLAARGAGWIEAALAIVLFGAALIVAGVKVLRRESFQPPLAPLGDGKGG